MLVTSLVLAAAVTVSAGDAAFARGDFDAALAAYERRLATTPHDGDALLGRGTLELYRGDLDAARLDLQHAQALLPNDPRIASRLHALDRATKAPGNLQASIPDGEADVPFVMTDPLPMIAAQIDGHDARLLIDTGAPALVLTAQAASRFGVAMHQAGEGVFLGGRRAAISEGTADLVELGTATLRSVPVSELPAQAPASLDGHPYDGIIGTTILQQFLSTIDYRNGRLVLRPRSAASAFDAAAAANGASIVPMWLVPDHFIFARGYVNGVGALFSIDTGLAGAGLMLTASTVHAAHISADAAHASTGYGGGGAVSMVPFQADTVRVGSYVQHAVKGVYSPNGDPYGSFPFAIAGAISHGFFRSAALTLDFQSMRLIVQR